MACGQLVFDDDDEIDREEVIDQAFAAFGIIPEEKVKAKLEEFFLWPDNYETFRVWLRLRTQWNHDFSGRRIGLNYASVEQVLRWEKIVGVKKAQMIDDFLVMEAAEITILNRK